MPNVRNRPCTNRLHLPDPLTSSDRDRSCATADRTVVTPGCARAEHCLARRRHQLAVPRSRQELRCPPIELSSLWSPSGSAFSLAAATPSLPGPCRPSRRSPTGPSRPPTHPSRHSHLRPFHRPRPRWKPTPPRPNRLRPSHRPLSSLLWQRHRPTAGPPSRPHRPQRRSITSPARRPRPPARPRCTRATRDTERASTATMMGWPARSEDSLRLRADECRPVGHAHRPSTAHLGGLAESVGITEAQDDKCGGVNDQGRAPSSRTTHVEATSPSPARAPATAGAPPDTRSRTCKRWQPEWCRRQVARGGTTHRVAVYILRNPLWRSLYRR